MTLPCAVLGTAAGVRKDAALAGAGLSMLRGMDAGPEDAGGKANAAVIDIAMLMRHLLTR